MTADQSATDKPHNPRAAFAYPDFRFFQGARFVNIVAMQMEVIAIGWLIYQITKNPIDLGNVGLVSFLPTLFFFPFTGLVADRFDRRAVLLVGQFVLVLCSLAMLALVAGGLQSILPIYLVVFVSGVATAFMAPASQALLPFIVPGKDFPNAVVWNSSVWQFATILGPAFGGLVMDSKWGATALFTISLILTTAAFFSLYSVKTRTGQLDKRAPTMETFVAGARYIWQRKPILGAISLDLFAVLVAGAVVLLPIFAQDILKTGPRGFGFLRAAPAAGAMLTAIAMAWVPPFRNAGKVMLGCVAMFGLTMAVFGLSKNIYLSVACLFLGGAFDMVSVIIRHTLVTIMTPSDMQGRVSAVNSLFIRASNDMGDWEAGVMAKLLGTGPSVVAGGIASMIVTLIYAIGFPSLRKFERLDDKTTKG